MSIKNREKLLSDIHSGLGDIDDNTPIGMIEVTFIAGDQEFTGSFTWAMDCICNDLYWDERGDWSEATSARVAHMDGGGKISRQKLVGREGDGRGILRRPC